MRQGPQQLAIFPRLPLQLWLDLASVLPEISAHTVVTRHVVLYTRDRDLAPVTVRLMTDNGHGRVSV